MRMPRWRRSNSRGAFRKPIGRSSWPCVSYAYALCRVCTCARPVPFPSYAYQYQHCAFSLCIVMRTSTSTVPFPCALLCVPVPALYLFPVIVKRTRTSTVHFPCYVYQYQHCTFSLSCAPVPVLVCFQGMQFGVLKKKEAFSIFKANKNNNFANAKIHYNGIYKRK